MTTTPVTAIRVEIPVDMMDRAPMSNAITKLAMMLERGNDATGNRWLVVTRYDTGTIQLIPQP